jgi:hypothetical protein
MSAQMFAGHPDGTGWFASRRSRSRAAAGRLEAARHGFERSLIALRKAALDAVDSGDLAQRALHRWRDLHPCAIGEGVA